ncbi:MAG: DUF5668 domain-containing protein [Ignavibacteriaceae bacterium]|nr:DUF5668 domain-containing protein [Ignavibacteriaceae bacterium]
MKTKHLFWGILFISIGLLWLLNHFMQIYVEWDYVWKLWPVVIILWGLTLIIGNQVLKGIVTAITAFVLAFALFASFQYGFFHIGHGIDWSINDDNNSNKYGLTDYSEPYDINFSKVTLNLTAGAGSFISSDTTNELFFAHAEGKKDNYSLSKNITDNKVDLNFDMNKGHVNFLHFNKIRNRVDFRLNSKPVWDLNFDLGAASVNIDLSPYKTENISIDMGAASLKLKVGDRVDKTNLTIDAGASSIDISVPEDAGCEIKTDVNLSSKNFDGFNTIDTDLFRTTNFENAKKKIYINIDSGVSSIKVTRYPSSSI